MPPSREIHFDGWTLKTTSGELCRHGQTVRLQGQTQQILEVLLAHPGEVVTREELTARLWPKGVVEFDTALNSAVRRLRRVLGDDPEAPRYVETIPRIGYRFIGTVGPPKSHQPKTRSPMLSAYIAALVTVMLLSSDAFEKRAPIPAVTELQGRARYFLERRSPGDLERSRAYFEQTLSLDPSNASAYAGLSSVYWLETMEGVIPRNLGIAKVEEFTAKALSLDPNEAEAHHRMALYSWNVGNDAAGEQHYRRAMDLDPANATMLAGRASDAIMEGDLDQGIALSERAVAAAPLNLPLRYNLAAAWYLSGHYDQALRVMNDLLEINPAYRADLIAFIRILQGRHQEALALAQKWPDGADKSQVLALAHFGMNQRGPADEALRQLITQVGETEPLRVVEVYGYRRDVQHAREWLHTAKSSHYNEGVSAPGLVPEMIRFSPFLRAIRADLD